MSKLQVLQRLLFHSQDEAQTSSGTRTIAIVGSPNVGKSVLFNALTGAHVIVSNYPGTTIEVSRGPMRLGDETIEVVDTPGMYSLSPITEEERVARTLLRQGRPELVLHVVDAKNLGRMLPFTLQLLEAGLPLMLVVNIMDEAARLGMTIDCARLEKELGIPVMPTVSVTGEGLDILRARIADQLAKGSSFSCALCSHQCKAFSVERKLDQSRGSHCSRKNRRTSTGKLWTYPLCNRQPFAIRRYGDTGACGSAGGGEFSGD